MIRFLSGGTAAAASTTVDQKKSARRLQSLTGLRFIAALFVSVSGSFS